MIHLRRKTLEVLIFQKVFIFQPPFLPFLSFFLSSISRLSSPSYISSPSPLSSPHLLSPSPLPPLLSLPAGSPPDGRAAVLQAGGPPAGQRVQREGARVPGGSGGAVRAAQPSTEAQDGAGERRLRDAGQRCWLLIATPHLQAPPTTHHA